MMTMARWNAFALAEIGLAELRRARPDALELGQQQRQCHHHDQLRVKHSDPTLEE
jgi:hypothetical protein